MPLSLAIDLEPRQGRGRSNMPPFHRPGCRSQRRQYKLPINSHHPCVATPKPIWMDPSDTLDSQVSTLSAGVIVKHPKSGVYCSTYDVVWRRRCHRPVCSAACCACRRPPSPRCPSAAGARHPAILAARHTTVDQVDPYDMTKRCVSSDTKQKLIGDTIHNRNSKPRRQEKYDCRVAALPLYPP